ncbi:MAG: sulfurtransferase FdhD [Alteromonadaceae bacterium]|uniref:formate dehydrogenase accessory sulfurtransferase FdhD n=1 Tax=uncultured Paraglaciecola sp. TaxID=1765024 RepID=UPI000C4246DA|nr:sulfurtransferase FdhD [Alteromonadaceae bacterium]|tara:strand:+ start:4605 stop:5372 length:768 start_codon:yes stop_codon:yes gene_type:complete
MTRELSKLTFSNNRIPSDYDDLAVEVPLAISVNSMALSVMMISPADMEDFLYGHLICESIVQSVIEVKEIQISPLHVGFEARVEVTGRRENALKQRRLSTVSAGCGLCNKRSMEEAFPPVEYKAKLRPLSRCDVSKLRETFLANQTYNEKAGAMHAAIYVNEKKGLVLCGEDIGRHNALDKVIGQVVRQRADPSTGYLAVTSRCGVELVQKAVVGGFSTLYCLSSPTTMAVDMAQDAGLNLIYVPRNNEPVIYQR